MELVIENIKNANNVCFCYRDSLIRAKISEVNNEYTGSGNTYTINLNKLAKTNNFFQEASYNGTSPNEIAIMRTRRILFGEERKTNPSFGSLDLIEYAIQSNSFGNSSIKIEQTIFKDLLGYIKPTTPELWKLVRLNMVKYILASNTVETIVKLNLYIKENIYSRVEFEGIRQKYYSNVPPDTILVNEVLS